MAEPNKSPSSLREGFISTWILLSVMVLTGVVAQYLHSWLSQHDFPGWTGMLSAFIVWGAYVVLFYKPLYRYFDTPYFAILNLLFIALGTAIGTFISQNAPADIFLRQYGPIGSKILGALSLNDVFHSWWYVGLFFMLIGSLVKMSINKGFTRATIGFHLAHLSPILIFAGFWVDYFYGFRGIIQLETGESTDVVKVYQGSSGRIVDSTRLDFAIQLDAFEFEKYEPDYRIQIWRNNPDRSPQELHNMGPSNEVPEIVASVPLVMNKIRHIYGSDLYFRMVDFYPNFKFAYTYPEVTDTIAPVDPGIIVEMKTALGETTLQFRDRPEENIVSDSIHLGASLEFYWNMPEDVRRALQEGVTGKPRGGLPRLILVGATQQVVYLSDDGIREEKLEIGQFYPFPNKDDSGITPSILYPDAAYLKANPASKGEELLNPVAKVEIWKKGWDAWREAYLYPNARKRGGVHSIPESNYLLALESIKDQETKYWKSTLTVIGADGQSAKSQTIKVNAPMLYKGYRFYQTDYDPNNPNYSGIGVSHEPGLLVIYVGFLVLVAGTFLLFYRRFRNKESEVTTP